MLCKIVSRTTNFRGNKYFLPLRLLTQDLGSNVVSVRAQLGAGTGGFDHAVWCDIDVPGFDFEGNAFQFNGKTSGAAPETVW